MGETTVKPIIAPEIKEQIETLFETEKQVIVHCCFPGDFQLGSLIRIWPTTYLIDENLGHMSKLIHAENISMAPYWTEVPPFRDFWFTLVFSGLPSNCKAFDLRELIAEEGGFYVPDIKRNSSDIYRIKIS